MTERATNLLHALDDGVLGDDNLGPDGLQQFVLADDTAGVRDEVGEQRRGAWTQAGRSAIQRQFAANRIELPRAELHIPATSRVHVYLSFLPPDLYRRFRQFSGREAAASFKLG